MVERQVNADNDTLRIRVCDDTTIDISECTDVYFGGGVLGNVSSGDRKFDDVSFGKRIFGYVSLGDRVLDDVSSVCRKLDDVSSGDTMREVSLAARELDDVSSGDIKLDDVSSGDTKSDDVSSGDTMRDKVSLGGTVLDDVSSGDYKLDDVSSGGTMRDNVSLGGTVLEDESSGDRKLDDVSSGDTMRDKVSLAGTVLDDVSSESRKLDDLRLQGETVGRHSAKMDVAKVAFECDDSSGDESTVSLQEDIDDDDLTTDGCGMVAAANVQTIPTFGSVSVVNSSDIHFGNKTVYQGPVTIKQLVYANSKEPILNESEKGHLPGCNGLPLSKEAQDVEHRDALKACLGQATRRRRYIGGVISLFGVVVISAILTILLRDTADPSGITSTGELFYERPKEIYDTTLSGKLRILPRPEWLAQPPSGPYDSLKLPVPYVIISHTATEPCFKQAECVFAVRTVQTYHIESKGWLDIGYNFVVGGDGYVYTGRGWDVVGAHTYGFNTCGLGISLIGTFNSKHPTDIQFLAMKQLIEEGVRLGKIRSDYKLLGHRQLSKTLSPGQYLFNDIMALPHWLNEPLPCNRAHELFEQGNTTHSNISDIASQ